MYTRAYGTFAGECVAAFAGDFAGDLTGVLGVDPSTILDARKLVVLLFF